MFSGLKFETSTNLREFTILVISNDQCCSLFLVQQYEVRVCTGDLWNGGTDANVYITVYGEKGDTGVRQLFKSNMADKFAKGNVCNCSTL